MNAEAIQKASSMSDSNVQEVIEVVRTLANMDAIISKPNEPVVYAFDPWPDGATVFDVGNQRKITAGDLRKARKALKCLEATFT